MTSQSPMHFNININLDKKKGRGVSGTPSGEMGVGREGSKSGGASPPAYSSGGYFGQHYSVGNAYQAQEAYSAQQQHQFQLRELYSKFSLYQQKQAETEAELAEAKTAALKKSEEVIARDQIIGVLTHTIKMKDHEMDLKNDEIRRLREDLDNMRKLQSQPHQLPQQYHSRESEGPQRSREVENLKAMIRDMQVSMNHDLAMRDKVINEQLTVIKEMMKKIGTVSQPMPTIPLGRPPSRPVSIPGSVPGSAGQTPRSTSGPALLPSERPNTAIEIPNQEIQLDSLIFADAPREDSLSRARSATPQSIVMSEEQFSNIGSKRGSIASLAAEISTRLAEPKNHVSGPPPTPPATKVNTAIALPCDEVSLDNFAVTPHRSRQGSQASAAGLIHHASRTSNASISAPVPPATKHNTAIEVPGHEVEVGSQF